MKAVAALLVVSALASPKFEKVSPMTKAAQNFVNSLSEAQRNQAVLPANSPDRTTWTYVPGKRKGVSWSELTDTQKNAARELLQASLSTEGCQKIEAIRGLEPILAEMENGNKDRDPNRYWFVFFGAPNQDSPWLWRYEGHHVSLTFASIGNLVVSSTPQFLGSNPAEHKGIRVLAKEQDLGFQLVESLSTEQRTKAILSEVAPNDIVTGASRKAAIEGHLGIPYNNLDPTQQKLLKELGQTHTTVQAKSEQSRRLDTIEGEGYDHIVFAWMGPIRRDARHYYRIQGKSFVIEYDTTQDNGNHVHTVWRDFNGDFGEDALANHYAHDHRNE